MIWATKKVSNAEWGQVQERYDKLSMTLGTPREMLLVSIRSDEPGCAELFMSLPSESYLSAFDGFRAIPESKLPKAASLQFGHHGAFEERFSWPVRLRR